MSNLINILWQLLVVGVLGILCLLIVYAAMVLVVEAYKQLRKERDE